jgi:transcription-repair coupling factor (superfamily II helicase)
MRLHWTGLKGSADLFAAVELAKQVNELCVIVTNQPAHSDRWRDGIGFFSSTEELENLRFPDWETLPYDAFSPHQDIISERLATLQTLRNATHGVLTVPGLYSNAESTAAQLSRRSLLRAGLWGNL